MRITQLYIKSYKNLQEFNWTPANNPITVLVGRNASGKTNLLEAIVKIFQYVLLYKTNPKVKPEFPDFKISYTYNRGQDFIEITNTENTISIRKNERNINIISAQNNTEKILPETIFLYYAGVSNRLTDSIQSYNTHFSTAIKESKNKDGRVIISYESIHYKAVLASLLLSSLDSIKQFLAVDFNITQLQQFTLYIANPLSNSKKNGDENNYWNIASDFKYKLDLLKTYSPNSTYNITTKQWEFPFSIQNITPNILSEFGGETSFFQFLDTLHAIGYLKDITIKFLKNTDAPIEFNDLSEGEKQHLAIRGALEIFRGKETLFLLDEPDAFAHPRWQWDFIPKLETILSQDQSQVFIATHSPLVLSTVKVNAFYMERGKIYPLINTYGVDANTALIRMNAELYKANNSKQDFDDYFEIINRGEGESEEGVAKKNYLIQTYGENHPEFERANFLIQFFK